MTTDEVHENVDVVSSIFFCQFNANHHFSFYLEATHSYVSLSFSRKLKVPLKILKVRIIVEITNGIEISVSK